jgi:hypothetical protein
MGLKLPPTRVNIADIRRKYHAAEREEKGGKRNTKDMSGRPGSTFDGGIPPEAVPAAQNACHPQEPAMLSVREPILKPVAIADLRPTQMTVGIREVMEKRKRWQTRAKRREPSFSASI